MCNYCEKRVFLVKVDVAVCGLQTLIERTVLQVFFWEVFFGNCYFVKFMWKSTLVTTIMNREKLYLFWVRGLSGTRPELNGVEN